jgi:hypothetical protein
LPVKTWGPVLSIAREFSRCGWVGARKNRHQIETIAPVRAKEWLALLILREKGGRFLAATQRSQRGKGMFRTEG